MDQIEKYLVLPLGIVYASAWGITGSFAFGLVLTMFLAALLATRRLTTPPIEAVLALLPPDVPPNIVAHRGAGHDAPENTLAAARLAIKNGAKAIEFDVEYASDGRAIIFHDDTLDRCTNGVGSVTVRSFEQLRTLSASCKHPKGALYPDERIPSLEEMVQLCVDTDTKMYIDVKSSPKKSAAVLVDLFTKYPKLYKLAIVCSFDPRIVYAVRRCDRRIVGGLTHRSELLTRRHKKDTWMKRVVVMPVLDTLLEWSHYTWLWYLVGNSVFLAHQGDVSASMIAHFKSRGIQVVVWTVNRRDDRNYFQKSLGCPVITDTMLDEGCGP